eukprot:g3525.t1
MMNSGASSLYSGGIADGARPVPRQACPEEPYQPQSHREEHYQQPRDFDLATYEPTFHIHQRRAASPPLSSEMVTRDVNMLPNTNYGTRSPSFGFGGGRGAGTRGLATKFGSAPADLYSYDASCSTSVGVSSSAEQAGKAMEAASKNVVQKHPNKYGSLAPNLYAHGSSASFQNFLDRSGISCSKTSLYSDGEQPLEREDTGAALSLASVDDFSSAAARKMEDFVVSGNRAPDGYDVLDHILNKGTLTGLGIGISLASEPSTVGGMAGMNVMMSSGQTNKKPTIDESMFGLGPEGEVDPGARVSDKLEGPSPIGDALAAELGPPEPPMEGTAQTEKRTTAIKPERDGEDQQKLFLEMSCDLQASSEGALTCSPQIIGDVGDAELIEKMSRELKEKDARIARLEEQFLALSKKEDEKKASPITAAHPDPLLLGVNRLRELPTLPEPPTFKSYRTVLAEHDALLSSNSPTVCRASVGSHSPDAVSGSGGSARKILSASPIGAVRFSPVVARPPLFQSSKQAQSLNTHGGITQCFNISTPAYKSPSVSRVFPTPNSSVIKKTGSGGGKPDGVLAGPGASIFNKASTIMTASTSSAGSAPRAVKSILKTSGVITSSVSKYASRINSKMVSANASGGRSSSSGAGATANTNSNTAEKLLAKEASVKEVRTLTIKDGDGGATSGCSEELVDEKGNTGVNLQSSPKTATEVCGPPLVLQSNTEQEQSEQKPANHYQNAGDEDHEVQKKTASGGRGLDCAEQHLDEYTHSDGEFVLRPLTQQKSSFYVLPDVILEERGAMVSSPEAEHEGAVDASSLVPEARSRKSSATSWTSTALQAPSETEMNALNASARGRSRAGFAPAGAGKATLIPKKRYGGNYPRGGGGVAGARRSRQSTHDSSFVMLNTSSTLEKDTRNRSGRGSPFDRSPGTGKQPLRCVVAAKAIPPASVPTLNRPRLDQLGGSMNAGVVDLRGHFGTRSAAESVKMKSRSTSAQNSRGGSRARSRGSSQARGGGAGGLSVSGGAGDQIFAPRSVGGLLPGGTHEERGSQGHEDASGAQELVESLMSVHKAKKPPSPCPQKQQGGVDLTTPTNKRCGAPVSNLRAGFNSVDQPLPNPPPVQHDFDANTNRENFNLTINTSDQHNFSLLSCADEQLQNPQHTASSGGIIGGFAAATASSVAGGLAGTTSMNGMMNETQRNYSRAASQSGTMFINNLFTTTTAAAGGHHLAPSAPSLQPGFAMNQGSSSGGPQLFSFNYNKQEQQQEEQFNFHSQHNQQQLELRQQQKQQQQQPGQGQAGTNYLQAPRPGLRFANGNPVGPNVLRYETPKTNLRELGAGVAPVAH